MKPLFSLLLLFIIGTCVSVAQVVHTPLFDEYLDWVHTRGTACRELGIEIKQNQEGHLITCQLLHAVSADYHADFEQESCELTEGVIQKRTPDPILLRSVSLFAPRLDIKDMAISPEGKIAVVGTFTGALTTSHNNWPPLIARADPNQYLFARDAFLVLLDADLNVLWMKSLGTPIAHTSIESVDFDSQESVIVHGRAIVETPLGRKPDAYFLLDFDFPQKDSRKMKLEPVYNGFLAKFPLQGPTAWVKSFQPIGGYPYYMPSEIVVDHEDNIILAGNYGGWLTIGDPNTTHWVLDYRGVESFMSKFNPYGGFQWAKTLAIAKSNDYDDYGIHDLAVDEQDRIYLCGKAFGDPDLDIDDPSLGTSASPDSIHYRSPFMARLMPNGEVDWNLTLSGKGSAENIEIDNLGMIHLLGYFYDSLDVHPFQGDRFIHNNPPPYNFRYPSVYHEQFLGRYTAEGALLNAFNLGSGGYNHMTGGIAAWDSLVVVNSSFLGDAEFGPNGVGVLYPNQGDTDIFLAKYHYAGPDFIFHGGGNGPAFPWQLAADSQTPRVRLFPNPLGQDGRLRVVIPRERSTHIKAQIWDNTGKKVLEVPLSPASPYLDLSSVAPGIYYLSLRGDDWQEQLKLIRQP